MALRIVNSYTYPKDLSGKPQIMFTARDKTSSPTLTVALYAPPAISVSDGMGYGNYELGAIGTTFGNAMDAREDNQAINPGSIMTQLGAIGEKAGGRSADAMALQIAAGEKAAGGITGGKLSAAALNKQRLNLNPNTVLQFTGPELRTFGFTFTLVPTDTKESKHIKEMINNLRERMYPVATAGTLILEYPDSFKVDFKLGGNFVPQYAESYLTGMSTTYNAAGNSYHTDGTPTDVTIQLQFTEFRALNREDITNLNKGTIVEIEPARTTPGAPAQEEGPGT